MNSRNYRYRHQNHYTEQKTTDTKEDIYYDSIYMKFKNLKNYPKPIYMRTIVALGFWGVV